MNDQTLADIAEQAAKNLADAAAAIEAGALTRMRDARAGQLRSPSFEAGGSTSPTTPDDDPANHREYLPPELRGALGYSDSTGRAAVHALNYGDRAQVDRLELDQIFKRARRDADRARTILARYNPHAPSVTDQTTATKESGGEPGCDSCARVDSPGTVGRKHNQRTPWWNLATRSTTLSDGTKVQLCNTCYESVEVGARWTGALPPKDWVEYLRDNGRTRKRSA